MEDKMGFYEFNQNNSGGYFIVNNLVSHTMFIEAKDWCDAVSKAEELGCYWNGVSAGLDCSCCGDRWNKPWDEEPMEFPIDFGDGKFFRNIEEYAQFLSDKYGWTSPDIRIFYSDGNIKEVFSKRVENE
jgi:hypothetical protein